MKGEAEIVQIETIGTVIRAKETHYLFYWQPFVIVDSVHTGKATHTVLLYI